MNEFNKTVIRAWVFLQSTVGQIIGIGKFLLHFLKADITAKENDTLTCKFQLVGQVLGRSSCRGLDKNPGWRS